MGAYYPIFLDLRDRPVVVVGGGRVALRKVSGLLEAGAHVRVIAPRTAPRLRAHRIDRRRYRPGDLRGAVLAFAATDDRAVNHAVAGEAWRRRIPVNVADSREDCTFLVPARLRRDDLQIAISTSGRSPRLAKALRRQRRHLADSVLQRQDVALAQGDIEALGPMQDHLPAGSGTAGFKKAQMLR